MTKGRNRINEIELFFVLKCLSEVKSNAKCKIDLLLFLLKITRGTTQFPKQANHATY